MSYLPRHLLGLGMSLWRHDVSGLCVIAFRGTNNLRNTIVDAFVLTLPSQELLGQSGAALQILKMNFADHWPVER